MLLQYTEGIDRRENHNMEYHSKVQINENVSMTILPSYYWFNIWQTFVLLQGWRKVYQKRSINDLVLVTDLKAHFKHTKAQVFEYEEKNVFFVSDVVYIITCKHKNVQYFTCISYIIYQLVTSLAHLVSHHAYGYFYSTGSCWREKNDTHPQCHG